MVRRRRRGRLVVGERTRSSCFFGAFQHDRRGRARAGSEVETFRGAWVLPPWSAMSACSRRIQFELPGRSAHRARLSRVCYACRRSLCGLCVRDPCEWLQLHLQACRLAGSWESSAGRERTPPGACVVVCFWPLRPLRCRFVRVRVSSLVYSLSLLVHVLYRLISPSSASPTRPRQGRFRRFAAVSQLRDFGCALRAG